MWQTTIVSILVAAAICVVGIFVYGEARWRAKTKTLRARLSPAHTAIAPATYDAREIENLPSPVRRYFRAVIRDGQPIVRGVRLSQDGQFRLNNVEDAWRSFRATQEVTTRPPGFYWDARIRMFPGASVFVHDAYVAGEGMLNAEALGVITVADVHGTREGAEGELLRYLAEAVWYPTALLPGQGVRWEAMDGSAARATLTDGVTSVSVEFNFDAGGLITSFKAASRYHEHKNGVPEFAPWHGRLWAYEVRDGMRIPLEGEVAWELPEGLFPYCRVRIKDIDYEFA